MKRGLLGRLRLALLNQLPDKRDIIPGHLLLCGYAVTQFQ